MKTKVLVLIAVAAIITLSFTFASSSRTQKQQVTKGVERTNYSEPVGGFASEDNL